MIEIDYSRLKGGGQIIRSAISLAATTSSSLKVKNIRYRTEDSGLTPELLETVRALSKVCNGTIQNDYVGSDNFIFNPTTKPRAGHYEFSLPDNDQSNGVGAATLLAQALLVPLSLAENNSLLEIHGGTHVHESPPYHYFKTVYGSFLKSIGYEFHSKLDRWGFYSRGKGTMQVEVVGQGESFQPEGVKLDDRGSFKKLEGFSAVGNLDPEILHRQTSRTNKKLEQAGFEPVVEARPVQSRGPGTIVFLFADYENISAGFTGYGNKNKQADKVAREAVAEFEKYHKKNEPVDPYLADQLVLPLAHSHTDSTFFTTRVTPHLHKIINLVRRLKDIELKLKENPNKSGEIHIKAS